MVKAVRKCLCAVENWPFRQCKLSRVSSVEQHSYKAGYGGIIDILVEKGADDFSMSGRSECLNNVLRHFGLRFALGHDQRENKLTFLECKISKSFDANIHLSMFDYFNCIKPMSLSRPSSRVLTEKSNKDESRSYRSIAGTLLHHGQAVLPQACVVAFKMK